MEICGVTVNLSLIIYFVLEAKMYTSFAYLINPYLVVPCRMVIREKKLAILEVGYPEESEMLRSAMTGSTVQVFEK